MEGAAGSGGLGPLGEGADGHVQLEVCGSLGSALTGDTRAGRRGQGQPWIKFAISREPGIIAQQPECVCE